MSKKLSIFPSGILPLVLFIFPPAFVCQSFSYSTDFDGRGTGAGFTVTVNRPSPDRPTYSERNPRTDTSPQSSSDDRQVQEHLNERYQEQLREAERAAAAARLRRQIEEATDNVVRLRDLLEQLERLENQEPSATERMKLTQEVLDLQQQFEAARTTYLASIPGYRERLAAAFRTAHVPLPATPRHYRSILIWGMFGTPADAQKAVLERERDPFSGIPFDDVFAFGDAGRSDVGRVSLDHLLGHFQKLSSTTRARLGLLNGATADEVVCHSNGCRIAEVLIETGMLKVGRLRILGGDNAALELNYLASLKKSKGLKEISVFILRGDLIPLISPGWQIIERMAKVGGPLRTFDSFATNTTYQLLGLTSRPSFNPVSDIKVHMMSYPAARATDLKALHVYDNYSRVVKGLRMMGCLETAGSLAQRCLIY